MTWPLARGLARDVAWDLGDSVLVMWILAWDCEQLLGDSAAATSRACATFFDANIFHPAPLTLAYSEHLVRAGAPDPSGLGAHGKSDPLLQPAVPLDVRAVRASACTCSCAS